MNRRIDRKYWLIWSATATAYFSVVVLIGRVVWS